MALGCALRFGVGGSVLVVGCLWSVGISWGYVGPLVGAMLPQLAVMWAHLGAMLAHLGAMLAHLGGDRLSGLGVFGCQVGRLYFGVWSWWIGIGRSWFVLSGLGYVLSSW